MGQWISPSDLDGACILASHAHLQIPKSRKYSSCLPDQNTSECNIKSISRQFCPICSPGTNVFTPQAKLSYPTRMPYGPVLCWLPSCSTPWACLPLQTNQLISRLHAQADFWWGALPLYSCLPSLYSFIPSWGPNKANKQIPHPQFWHGWFVRVLYRYITVITLHFSWRSRQMPIPDYKVKAGMDTAAWTQCWEPDYSFVPCALGNWHAPMLHLDI